MIRLGWLVLRILISLSLSLEVQPEGKEAKPVVKQEEHQINGEA